MYLKYTSPDKVGISKEVLNRFLDKVNVANNKIHSLAMLRGNFIFFEGSSKYHTINELHRMYSQTKSYVGLAIGILVDENKIDINNTLASYFPEYINENTDKVLLTQTIEQTLKMTSSVTCDNWFTSKEKDRVKLYFSMKHDKLPGKKFKYDSAGSQVLCALVEKISGMHLIDFLKEKVFKYLDYFDNAYILSNPDGRNWGDSGLICDLRANLSLARMYLNKGTYNNHRIVSESWVNLQTTKKVNTTGLYKYRRNGYGYQIWMLKNGYAFFGMGNQLTLVFPSIDLAITMTSSCFPFYKERDAILDAVYELVDSVNDCIKVVEDKPLQATFKTYHLFGKDNIDKYLNKEINLEEKSPIKSFKIVKLSDNKYQFNYVKDNKNKTLEFRLNDTCETTIYEDNNYKAIGSGAIINNKLVLFFEIIDFYLGSLTFKIDLNPIYPHISISKNTEYFIEEYKGIFRVK